MLIGAQRPSSAHKPGGAAAASRSRVSARLPRSAGPGAQMGKGPASPPSIPTRRRLLRPLTEHGQPAAGPESQGAGCGAQPQVSPPKPARAARAAHLAPGAACRLRSTGFPRHGPRAPHKNPPRVLRVPGGCPRLPSTVSRVPGPKYCVLWLSQPQGTAQKQAPPSLTSRSVPTAAPGPPGSPAYPARSAGCPRRNTECLGHSTRTQHKNKPCHPRRPGASPLLLPAPRAPPLTKHGQPRACAEILSFCAHSTEARDKNPSLLSRTQPSTQPTLGAPSLTQHPEPGSPAQGPPHL